MPPNIKSAPFRVSHRAIEPQEEIKRTSTPISFGTTQQQSDDSLIINDNSDIECEFEDAKSDFEHFEDMLAIRNAAEREKRIKQLISDGLDVNATKNGQTILDVAIERRCSSKIVELLINNGSKIDTIDLNGCTILHRSVQNRNIKVVKLLLETDKKEINKLPLAKFFPKCIFVHQIELDIEDKNGFTALDYAKQNSEMYTLLQNYGGKHSGKFLHFRNLNIEELDLSKLVTDNDYCFDALAKALEIKDEYNRIKAIDWLLENGANINATKNNRTLLSVAAEEGNIEDAVLLIRRGAHEGINFKDSDGKTLLLSAIIQNKLGYAEYFIEQGIDITTLDNSGNNALHHASANFDKLSINSTEVHMMSALFEELAGRGADIYAKNNNSLTPFEYAFQARIAPNEIARLFKIYIEKGNRNKNTQLVKNARSSSGETLLEYFIDNKLFDSAESCINLGANVNQPLSNGSSLLSKAFQNGNMEGVRFLRKNRANANLGNDGKKKNNKLYFRAAFGCAVAFSLGMGIAATFTLVKMSPLALAVVATTSLVAVVVSISLLILYKKIKSERRKNRAAINSSTASANLEEVAINLFSELGSIPERLAEAGALYLEMRKSAESISERIGHKQEFIESRFQNIQQSFGSFQSFNNTRDSNIFKRISSAIKDALNVYSNLPVSNLHLLSLSYHLSWEIFNAIFHAITDPTLASTVLTAIRERRWPEDKHWCDILRNTVPNLIRNQELMQNVIVPTLTDIFKSLSESEEERKFMIYTLVCLKDVIDEVYTASAQESLPRILGTELAGSIDNIAVAINDLLNCYGEEEIEQAKISNELDYFIGKLTSEETRQFVTYLGGVVNTLAEFQGQITNRDKQSIRKLVDYCLDPEPNDKPAAEELLKSIRTYVKNNVRIEPNINSNLPSSSIEQLNTTTRENVSLVAGFRCAG
ncbi:ankyrin repeat domain-containing protein [Wolbachia endosymbiont of Folsomia candida]|uniref:ankyrin repeat domain-containing protein n=1 Tax=Wolbachia endosymbiont of Folsomia candida TaxID=169402 RepID=UPI000B04CC99|nr:ankyrin repeat domain-containing protein [Wolbachia endosymbiont of Folsomia candida]AWW50823.1 hypothetical protein ASM33_08150 [Wolbachia endosymbiont of Folsomia candida]